ncbi:MAG: hypothetical protein ACK50G_01205 [bacterium]
MHRQTLVAALPAIVCALGQTIGKRVIFHRGDSCTDGQTIRLSPLPADDAEAAILALADVGHEGAGHLAQTDFEAWRQAFEHGSDAFVRMLANAVEDVRIEHHSVRRFPGHALRFCDLIELMKRKGRAQASDAMDLPMLLTRWLLMVGYAKHVGYPTADLAQQYREFIEARGLAVLGPIIERGADRIPRLVDTAGAIALAREIAAELDATLKSPPEQQPEAGTSSDSDSSGDETTPTGGSDDQAERDAPGDASEPLGEEADQPPPEGAGNESDDEIDGAAESCAGPAGDSAPQDNQSGQNGQVAASDDASPDEVSGPGGQPDDQGEADEAQDAPSGSPQSAVDSAGGDDSSPAKEGGSDEDSPQRASAGRSTASPRGPQAQAECASAGSAGIGVELAPGPDGTPVVHRPSPEQADAALRELATDQYADPTLDPISKEMLEERVAEVARSGAPGSIPVCDMPVLDMPMVGSGRDLEREAAQAAGGLDTALYELLLGQQRGRRRYGLSGQPDGKRLWRLRVGDTAVLYRKSRREGLDSVIELLVDMSGSMGGNRGDEPLRHAMRTAAAVMHAVDGIEDVSVAVSLFPYRWSAVGRAKHWDEDRFTALTRMDGDLGVQGGTPLAEAVMSVGLPLATRKESRKLLFVVTDGAPDNIESAIQAVQVVGRAEVEVIGIGIGEDAPVGEIFPLSLNIERAEDLAQAMFFVLEQRLAA